jgi:hypothetical protein
LSFLFFLLVLFCMSSIEILLLITHLVSSFYSYLYCSNIFLTSTSKSNETIPIFPICYMVDTVY